jgi:hypothetical protein
VNGGPDGLGELEVDEEHDDTRVDGDEGERGGMDDEGAEGIGINEFGIADATAIEDLDWDGAHSERNRRTRWPSP